MRKLIALSLVMIIALLVMAPNMASARSYSLCDSPGAAYGMGAGACAACIAAAVWGSWDLGMCFGSNVVVDVGGSESSTFIGPKPHKASTAAQTPADADGLSGRSRR